MLYLIQENIFKERHYDLLLNIMQKFNFEHEIVKYVPFLKTIAKVEDFLQPYETERKDIFCFGGVGMALATSKYGWTPGSLLNENHDYTVYAPKYGFENMLNGDGVVITKKDSIPFEDNYFFARPVFDSKIFTGKVFSRDSWDQYITRTVDTSESRALPDDVEVLVSPTKDIQQEVRFWVVNGKVVTASRYKIGSQALYENYDNESYFVDFAQSMVDKYQPAEAFVIDVCLADNKLKIVEINNINCAGFYDCNMYKLLEAIEAHFNR